MRLKISYTTKEEIPAAFRELYAERDGQWVLSEVEGMKTQVDVDKLTKSLNAEREEHKKTKDALKKFEGIDVDEVKDSLAELEELRTSGKKLNDDEINKIVERRVKADTRKIETELNSLKLKYDDASKQLGTLQTEKRQTSIREALRSAATKTGIRQEAIDDVLAREGVFDLTEDGKIVTKDGCGVTPGLDPSQWLAGQVKNAPHWLGKTQGGGGNPGKGGIVSDKTSLAEIIKEAYEK